MRIMTRGIRNVSHKTGNVNWSNGNVKNDCCVDTRRADESLFTRRVELCSYCLTSRLTHNTV